MAIFVVLAIVLFNVIAGFNDGGNLLATTSTTRRSAKQIVVWILLAVGLGPLLIGTRVADTIAYHLINIQIIGQVGLFEAVLVASAVVFGSWLAKVPTSLSLSLLGALLGMSVVRGAPPNWGGFLFSICAFFVVIAFGGGLAFGSTVMLRKFFSNRPATVFPKILHSIFVTLQGLAYGANDMEKAFGLLLILKMSFWNSYAITVLSFAAGLLIGGWSIASSVSGMFKMRSFEGLCTSVSTSLSVLIAALVGGPVSTSQTIDSTIFGMGVASNPYRLNWNVAKRMAMSWALTSPIAFVVAIVVGAIWR